MRETKDIISKLHERIGNPILASLFMYLIFLSDENGVVKASYSEIGRAFKMSKQLVSYNISLLRSFDGILTEGFPITICNIGFYKGFTHTSFTPSLPSLDADTPKKKAKKDEERYSDDPKMDDVIRKWLAYKKEKKQTYKPIGLKTLISKLQKLSNNDTNVAEQIVEQSIMNNYSGLFPLKNNASNENLLHGMKLENSKNIDYGKGLDRFYR